MAELTIWKTEEMNRLRRDMGGIKRPEVVPLVDENPTHIDQIESMVEKGSFHIRAVSAVDEGIEILSGKSAGKRKADGSYTKNSINDLVDRKLRVLTEGLKRFGNAEPPEEKGRKKSGGRTGGKKKT
jgi:hypothetical protein